MRKKPTRIAILGWVVLGLVVLALILGLLFPAPSGHVVSRRSMAKIGTLQAAAALKQYLNEYGYGHALSGNNARTLAKLRGDNPRKIVFFETSTKSINAEGELIDPWGTPYTFDLSDPQNPRIWSSGKDRRNDGGGAGSDDIPNWR